MSLLSRILARFVRISTLDEDGYEYQKQYIPEEYIPRVYELMSKSCVLNLSNKRGKDSTEEKEQLKLEITKIVEEIWPWAKDWDGFAISVEDPHPYVQRTRPILF